MLRKKLNLLWTARRMSFHIVGTMHRCGACELVVPVLFLMVGTMHMCVVHVSRSCLCCLSWLVPCVCGACGACELVVPGLSLMVGTMCVWCLWCM